MKTIHITTLLACILLALSGCRRGEDSRPSTVAEPILTELRVHYAPDDRTAIFDIEVVEHGTSVVVKGEVDDKQAKEDLMSKMKERFGSVTDSVTVLPAEDLGNRTYGIITVSVANMRTKPKEGAELGSQALMGTIVRIWKKGRGYCYVQTPDRYLGWMDADQLHRVSPSEAEAWRTSKKLFVKNFYDMVSEQPQQDSYPVSDVTAGAVLKDLGTKGTWCKVGLADGRTGYIRKSSVINNAEWGMKVHPVPDNIERTGRFLMGVPYLWGGTSVKGVDCSGFTKTVFLLNGQLLNRDANQQAEQGIAVEPGRNFENLHKGDLLFFGRKAEGEKPERIVHVAIYLGNRMFIHSSGKVRLSSFDPASDYYDEYNLKRFVRARRVIAESPTTAEVHLQ